ncbi:MAG: restriction endonuclease subunit S [Anaerolineae bacterium]|nr:restriction endonuclease subunit S [Anaerolineae bacterium]
MSEWRETTLGEIVTFQRGHDLTTSQFKDGPYPIVSSVGIIGYHNEFTTESNGITIGRSGNSIGNPIFVESKFWAHNTTLYVKEFHNSYPKFIYYLLKTLNFRLFDSGSAVPSLNRNYIHPYPVKVPDLSEQRRIAAFLSTLDAKLDLLRRQNHTLEQIAQTVFKRWFVDFEFPNDHGQPYKSSGGSMVVSELGEIPEGWRVGTFGDISINYDSKRIPLSSREREQRKGPYPYYGATSIMDYVDNYLFDGVYVLMGEDGTVIDNDGHPVLQYVFGKFWANNHAHVLQGKGKISTNFIYLFLKRAKVNHIVTGAVQLKINQGNMNSLKLAIPDDDALEVFDKVISPIFDKTMVNLNQIQTLTRLRDTLLPKLMSGQLRVQA